MKIFYFLICLYIFTCGSKLNFRGSQHILKFQKNGTFKILQLTDLHFGEAEPTQWGPIQDKNSTRVMKNILSIEKPDLVILTGDMLTGNNIIDNATDYWREMVNPMIELGYRWAITFGNHDDLASGKGGTRHDLMKFDMSFPLSLSQFGPSNIHGVSNYILELLSSDGKEIKSLFYLLDSEDSNCEDVSGSGCILPDQVEWYSKMSKMYRQRLNKTIPALSFFHIPLQEYMFLWNEITCYGTNNDTVSCQALDTGLFSSFKENDDVKAVFVGHNHGNDYCGMFDGIQLCFGRHSGYGGYGDWERGARVIELTENPWSLRTWIRFEDGRKEEQGIIHNPSPPFQYQCSD